MNVKVDELMSGSVVTAEPHHDIQHVRQLIENNRSSAVPIVDTDRQPVGNVSATDFSHDLKAGAPVKQIMTEMVYTVPRYDDVSIAARVMPNHGIHRVVVTHEKAVVGVLG